MSAAEIRAECRAYAAKYVDIHRREFKRLGIFGRWEDPYLTMSAGVRSRDRSGIRRFSSEGYVYKGLKPVHWCIKDQTALAEAEVEYENHSSPSIYVKFRLVSDAAALDPVLAGRDVYAVIWTTTPWTIPANLAIAFNPKYEYVAVDTPDGVMIVAGGLLDDLSETLGWEKDVIARLPGVRLEHAIFRHPFLERDSLGVLGDHVTLDQGTGAVHTAPGHGQEDFVVGQRYGLPVYCPVDHAGRFFQAEGVSGQLPETLLGKTVWQGNPIVIDLLEQKKRYCCTRSSSTAIRTAGAAIKPTIFRATEQWFIGMDREDLRSNALAAIEQVKWHPAWGEDRIRNMVAGRPDWCISRQRVWGVPITVFYCDSCQEPFTDKRVLENVVEEFRRHTADVWYSKTAAELMGGAYVCSKCGSGSFRKETDILDVWFDSGSSHLAVLTEQNGLSWPADLYIEGGDQYRGWFQSSLLVGVGLKGGAPYRGCATHGWTLDARAARCLNRGNGIEPEEIVKKYGADILRLWVGFGRFHRRCEAFGYHPVEVVGSLPKIAKYVSLHARQSPRFRSGYRRGSGLGNGRNRSMDVGEGRGSGPEMPRLVRKDVVPLRISRGVRFRRYRPERRLFRHSERPALHNRAAIPGPEKRSNCHLPPAPGPGASAGAAADLYV